MSLRSLVIGALALLFGGSAAVGVNLLYTQSKLHGSTETVPVVVAARDIPRGTMVVADSVRTRDFPKDLIPPGSVTTVDDAVERVALHTLVRDEPLLDGTLTAKHARGGLAGLVPKGMRAFTIQTPHIATHVAGFILPGNKVDVLLTMNSQGPNDIAGGAVTTTLLQNVEVLAVDQRLDAPSENKVDPQHLQSVTLLVTPDQAAMLELGQSKGSLHLSLRNPEDTQPANAHPATLSGLLFRQEKPWMEQVKEFVDALAKLKAESPRQAPPPSGAEAEDDPLEIRTLRGTYSSAVQIQPIRPKRPGR